MKRIKELRSDNQPSDDIQTRPESKGITNNEAGVSCATDNLESKYFRFCIADSV